MSEEESEAICDICKSEEETDEAVKAEEKIEKLEERIDTGQHPAPKEKYIPLDEEDLEDISAQ